MTHIMTYYHQATEDFMINRKITSRLEKFFEDNGRYTLLIDGA